jgi:hypothetical protein
MITDEHSRVLHDGLPDAGNPLVFVAISQSTQVEIFVFQRDFQRVLFVGFLFSRL